MRPHLAIAALFLLAGTLACRLSAPLVVSGTVADVDGIPPALIFIALLSLEEYTLSASTTSDADGRYRLEAPGGQDYLLLAIPLSGEIAEGYNGRGHRAPTGADTRRKRRGDPRFHPRPLPRLYPGELRRRGSADTRRRLDWAAFCG